MSRLCTAAAALGLATLAGLTVANTMSSRRALRANPPTGRFMKVDGTSLHYVDQGQGQAIVFLHGNGAMIEDFRASGLLDMIEGARVIAFDRPGFGHSGRPRGKVWTPSAQADLIREALIRLNISDAIIVGHSWGALVAITMAIRHPSMVRGLVLASGYYFPSPRLDTLLSLGGALPILGDLINLTLAPPLSRLSWKMLMRKIFGPAEEPAKFAAFPVEMALRPSQLRAASVETTLMMPAAANVCRRYGELTMPVAIIAGLDDRLVDFESQSKRLHDVIAHSTLRGVPGCGHMVHQTATAAVLAVIDDVRDRIGR